MAIFMLDCDSVTSTNSSITSLVTQFSQLADAVNGYDTACEDGFDFAGGKAAIASNIEACTTKVQNTAKLIEGVVTSHTTLQNTFTLDQAGATNVDAASENRVDSSTTTTTTPGDTNNNVPTTNTGNYSSAGNSTTSGNYSSSGSSSGGNYSSGGGSSSGGSYSSGGYSSGGAASVGAGVAAGSVAGSVIGGETTGPVDVTSKINSVDQVTVDVNKLDPANKTQFITGMTYNQAGYATYDNKYVIVCDTTLANVGDNIVFTNSDGSTIDCVVGAVVDYSQEYKGNVSFIVNNTWNAQGTSNLAFDLKNMKILNNGQYVKKV